MLFFLLSVCDCAVCGCASLHCSIVCDVICVGVRVVCPVNFNSLSVVWFSPVSVEFSWWVPVDSVPLYGVGVFFVCFDTLVQFFVCYCGLLVCRYFYRF